MKRWIGLLGATLLAALLMVPSVLAAEPAGASDDSVLISTNGDLSIPAGDQVDVALVVRGTATVAGQVETLVVVNGRAVLTGATAETIVAIGSQVELGGGTVVTGDVLTLESDVTHAGGATVGGAVRDLAPAVAGFGLAVGTAMLVLYAGLAIAAVVAGLLLAGLAARQLRDAESAMRHEPIPVITAGLLGLVLPILVTVVLSITVVGIPLAIAILVGFWPLVAFLGYLVAGIAIGEWIVGRASPGVVRERPYLAAAVGIVLLQIVSLVPLVGAIASFYGFGAVLLLGWRTLRAGTTGPTASAPTLPVLPSPSGEGVTS